MSMIHAADTHAPNIARRRLLRPYAIAVVILGLVLIGRGAWEIPAVVDFARHGVAVDARLAGFTVVADGRGRFSRYANVRYTTLDGRQIAATTEDRVSPTEHAPGERLRITYLSTDPRRVRLTETAGAVDFWTWFLFGLGSTVGLAGLVWLWRLRRPS